MAGETHPLSKRQRRNAKHKALSLLSNQETNVVEEGTILAVDDPTPPIPPKSEAQEKNCPVEADAAQSQTSSSCAIGKDSGARRRGPRDGPRYLDRWNSRLATITATNNTIEHGTIPLTQPEPIQHQDHVIRSIALENIPMSSIRREESRLLSGTRAQERGFGLSRAVPPIDWPLRTLGSPPTTIPYWLSAMQHSSPSLGKECSNQGTLPQPPPPVIAPTEPLVQDHNTGQILPPQSDRPPKHERNQSKKKKSKPQPANRLSRKELDQLYRHLPPLERAAMINQHREQHMQAPPEKKRELPRQHREYIAQLEKGKTAIWKERHRKQEKRPSDEKRGIFRQDRRRIAQLEKEHNAMLEEQLGKMQSLAIPPQTTKFVGPKPALPTTLLTEVQKTLVRRGPGRNALPVESQKQGLHTELPSAPPQTKAFIGHGPNVDKEVQRLLSRQGRKRMARAKREQAAVEKEQQMENEQPAVPGQTSESRRRQPEWIKEEKQLAKQEREFRAEFGLYKPIGEKAQYFGRQPQNQFVPPQIVPPSRPHPVIPGCAVPLSKRVTKSKEAGDSTTECLERWKAIQFGEGWKFYPPRVPSPAVEQLRVSSGMACNLAPYYPRPPVTSALEQLRVSSGMESMNLEESPGQPASSRFGVHLGRSPASTPEATDVASTSLNTILSQGMGIEPDWSHLTVKQRQALQMKWGRMTRR